jgi:hypothetical protein
MTELNIQKYLRSGKTPEDLKEELGINSRRNWRFKNLVSFKYNQIDSPKNHPVVLECRGIILDENNNWKVVAYPFNRFFNADEGHAQDIDWDSAVVQEKLDGSLIIYYWYMDQWFVATSGSADASGSVGEGLEWREKGQLILPRPNSFAQYFQCTATKCHGAGWNNYLNKEYCYMFELTGPLNRIVVYHDVATITLLGARNINTLEELPARVAASHFRDVPYVKEFALSSVDEIVRTFESISPMSQEGYVVHDKNFNRIKVKSPAYVAIHHAKDGLTTKAFVEIARSGETSEVIAHFPEYKPALDEAKERVSTLIAELEAAYDSIKDIEVQKDFALVAIKTKCSGALFAVRGGKCESIADFISKMSVGKLLKLLGYKDDS